MRKVSGIAAALFLGGLMFNLFGARAEELALGAKLPAVTVNDQDSKPVDLAAAGGTGWTLVYFYPKADTPGCTKQACSLRDANTEIAARGAAILGVSAQGSDSHQRFSDKFNLNFRLLADTDLTVAKAYGVAGSGLGGLLRSVVKFSERVTFIIDEKGRISHIIDDPDCPDHGEQVLALL